MDRRDDERIERLGEELASLKRLLADLEKRLGALSAESRPAATPPPLPAGYAKPAPVPQTPQPAPQPKPAPIPDSPRPGATPLPPLGQPPLEKAPSLLRPPGAPKAAPPHPAGVSLEQRLGASWLNKIGIVVLLLGAVFFFQYAAQKGWIHPTLRVLIVALGGAALLGAGEWTLRKAMRVFAAGATGGGIALLYAAAYAASPKFYALVPTPVAFALMCAVTVLGAALSVRSRMLSTTVLVQIGAYLTPLLLSTGRNEQVVLMCYLLVAGAGFLAVGAIRNWSAPPLLALAGTILLTAGWCGAHYSAPQAAATLAFAWALTAMFLAYAVVMAGRGRMNVFLALAMTVVAAGALMELLGFTLDDMPGHGLFVHLLALGAALLAVGTIRQWNIPPLLAVGGTVMLVSSWCGAHYSDPQATATLACAWSLFALFVGFAAVATRFGRAHVHAGIAMAAACAVAMSLLLLVTLESMGRHATLTHLFLMDAVLLGVCLWRRWHWLRMGLLVCSYPVIMVTMEGGFLENIGELASSVWIWAFYALLTADVLLRAWRKSFATREKLDAALASLATALMFWSTYGLLLSAGYQPWMGAYTALLAAGAIVLSVFLLRGRRAILGNAYLACGLVLAALFAPIQFDRATITYAWAIQAAVTMLIARRLASRMLLAKSFAVLLLAIAHYVHLDVPYDGRLAATMLTFAGTAVPWRLLLAATLAVSGAVSAGLLRAGPAIENLRAERTLAGVMLWLGAGVWAVEACQLLPAVGATWAWLALACGVSAVALARRSAWASASGAILILLTTAKLLAYDTLALRLDGPPAGVAVAVNWQFGSALAVAGAGLLCARALARRLPGGALPATLRHLLILPAAGAIVWAGSFEIDRYFHFHGQSFANVAQARQVGYSIWWAVYAAVVLAAGFLARYAPVRYLALALFAVTLGKVLLVDMSDVEAGYRIASFVALGGLLVGASLLYQKYFREALAHWDRPPRDKL